MESITIPSGRSDQTTVSDSTIFTLFEEALGTNKRFKLVQIGVFLYETNVFVVHLKDVGNRTLLTITVLFGQRQTYNPEHIIQITTTSGQVIFTAKRLSNETHAVLSGADGLYLGQLKYSPTFADRRSVTLSAKGAMDELLFGVKIDQGGCCSDPSPPSQFDMTWNDVTLARIQQLNNGTADVELNFFNSRNLDSRTKLFLILVGYCLYESFFCETSVGRTGKFGAQRKGRCFGRITSVFMLLFFLFVFSMIIYNLWNDFIAPATF